MIYIVIPVHNRRHYTRQCLCCLQAQTHRAHRVVVVDDGSTDDTAEMIWCEFPDVIVRTGNGSLWWAGGTNLGIRYVLEQMNPQPTDFVLTLNDDTEVAPDYLTNLLKAYYANKPCVVGSVSVDSRQPARLLYAGTHLDMLFAGMRDLAKTKFNQSYRQLAAGSPYFLSDCLPGRGMLIPKAVFGKIGLLDDTHFQHHMADLDFSIRARKAGFPLVVATDCVVLEHAEATGFVLSKSTSLRQFWSALWAVRSPINLKTRYRFARRHAPVMGVYLLFDLARIWGGYLLKKVLGP